VAEKEKKGEALVKAKLFPFQFFIRYKRYAELLLLAKVM
jgi:hypothetical protein